MKQNKELWYSVDSLGQPGTEIKLSTLANSNYNGIVLDIEKIERYEKKLDAKFKKIFRISNDKSLECLNNFLKKSENSKQDEVIVLSEKKLLLDKVNDKKCKKCFHAFVTDSNSLLHAIDTGVSYDFVNLKFKDPTNIPLELVLAKLQKHNTKIIKEIYESNNSVDAKVVFSVMEEGVDGVQFSPTNMKLFEEINCHISEMERKALTIEVGEVSRSEAIGVGHRSCIDLTTLFSEAEGILVGSTSQGGLLCCSEVFHLPYMEKRPFRINAGAVHSYVFNSNDTTNYLTELKAGVPMMVVDTEGNIRSAPVGRIKTEVRPLRMIEVKFSKEKYANVIMQDDWHVRIFNEKKKPANITELKPGDKVLGYTTNPGRHVGIKIDEFILEK